MKKTTRGLERRNQKDSRLVFPDLKNHRPMLLNEQIAIADRATLMALIQKIEFIYEALNDKQQGGKRWMNMEETSAYIPYAANWILKRKTELGGLQLEGGKLIFDRLEIDKYMEAHKFSKFKRTK